VSRVEDALQRDYRVAFLRYLPRREEGPLHAGYQVGRRAVAEGLSVLQLAKIHHEVFRGVLEGSPNEDLDDLVTAASEFFMEVLATYHMVHAQPAIGHEEGEQSGTRDSRHQV